MHHLAGERFVDFPQVNIRHRQAKALEQLGNRIHRANTHFFWRASTHGNPAVHTQGFDSTLSGFATAHQQDRSGAIGKLRGVACSNELTLFNPLAVFPHRLEARQIFKSGGGTVALVTVRDYLLMTAGLAFLVKAQLARCQWHDLIGKQAFSLGRGRALLALQSILILHFAADVVAPGDDFGGFEHRDIGRGHAFEHGFGLGAVGVFVLVLGQRQRLHATGHGYLHFAGHDAVGRHADTHQARSAHAIERHTRHGIGQAAGIGTQAPDIVALGTLLGSGAHDHVFHRARLDARALDHRAHHVAAQHRRFGIVERATEGLGQGRAGGGYDHNVIQIHIQGSLFKRVEGVAADGVHHTAGAFAAFDFDAHAHHCLHGLAQCFDPHHLAMAANSRTDLDRCREAQPVSATVDAHGQIFELHQLRHKQIGQRQSQVAVGDAGTERPAGGALRVDMDPLMIAGGLGKQVDPLLGQQQPVGAPQIHALGRQQLRGTAESRAHTLCLTLVAS